MLYANELSLLLDVFKKSHIAAELLTENDFLLPKTDDAMILPSLAQILHDSYGSLKKKTIYCLTDAYDRCYSLFLLVDTPTTTLVCLGPYLKKCTTNERLLQIEEKNGIPPARHSALSELYAGMTVLSSDSHLFTLLHTFCERMWHSPSYTVKDITDEQRPMLDEPLSKGLLQSEPDDTLVRMKFIERRYEFENEIIHAVQHGHLHLEGQLLSAFSGSPFEQRLPDAVRNAKNYCIIMNTLLRKAAEQGGVHPFYLDRVSSEFAAAIEGMRSTSEPAPFMCQMFRTYCRLVRDHSLQHFSTLVKQTVLMIEADLSVELSPARLAAAQRVSLGHLCTIFKQETGKTLTEYIRERRMEYASYLLETTDLQIQTVALHCGIIDVQYFSKLFKRQLGISPTQYRLAHRQNAR